VILRIARRVSPCAPARRAASIQIGRGSSRRVAVEGTIRPLLEVAWSLQSFEHPRTMELAHMTKTILILGISAVLASVACSSAPTGSGDSNYTSETKKPTDTKSPADNSGKPAPSSSSKTDPGPVPAATGSSKTDPVAVCMSQCLGSNAKAKKLEDDHAACMARCPADPGGPMTDDTSAPSAPGTGGGSGAGTPVPTVDSAVTACWDGCDKPFDDACRADQATCNAIFACEDKCEGTASGTSSSSSSDSSSDSSSSSKGDSDNTQ
jgi:hypothetical protein